MKGETRTHYQSIVEVLDVLGKVGISKVGLATKPRAAKQPQNHKQTMSTESNIAETIEPKLKPVAAQPPKATPTRRVVLEDDDDEERGSGKGKIIIGLVLLAVVGGVVFAAKQFSSSGPAPQKQEMSIVAITLSASPVPATAAHLADRQRSTAASSAGMPGLCRTASPKRIHLATNRPDSAASGVAAKCVLAGCKWWSGPEQCIFLSTMAASG